MLIKNCFGRLRRPQLHQGGPPPPRPPSQGTHRRTTPIGSYQMSAPPPMTSSQQQKKKQRCFAQDKFEHKFLKRADRWNGLGFSKQQQVYRDRNITVTAKEQTLVAQQQQLDADRQQLSSEEARLQATACPRQGCHDILLDICLKSR